MIQIGKRGDEKNQLADIIATVNLFPTEAGERRVPTPDGKFNCFMVIDEANFDVRLHLESTRAISPGQTGRVPISFLDREHAKKYYAAGKNIRSQRGQPDRRRRDRRNALSRRWSGR